MKQLISRTVYIDNVGTIDNLTIEQQLKATCGEVIRWAIVDILPSQLKICLTEVIDSVQ